jgi:phosphatidylserine synthase
MTDRPVPLLRSLRFADLFTLANAGAGLAALVLAAQARDLAGLRIPSLLVLAGILLDGLDGFAARAAGGSGPLGPVLDTLADAVTFVAAPAAIIALALLWSPTLGSAWAMAAAATACAALFLACGLLRLARYEVLRTGGLDASHFHGLSTPGGAVAVLALVLGMQTGWPLAIVALASSLLMSSRLAIPKLRGWLGGVGVLFIGAVLLSTPWPAMQRPLAWAMLGALAVYVVAGPAYSKRLGSNAAGGSA